MAFQVTLFSLSPLAASRLESALFIMCTLPFLNPGWSTVNYGLFQQLRANKSKAGFSQKIQNKIPQYFNDNSMIDH